MFDLPDAKRVRRSDLYGSSTFSRSPSPSPEDHTQDDPEIEAAAQAKLRAHFAELYDFSSVSLPAQVGREEDAVTAKEANAAVKKEQRSAQKNGAGEDLKGKGKKNKPQRDGAQGDNGTTSTTSDDSEADIEASPSNLDEEQQQGEVEKEEEPAQEFEFRLFSTAPTTKTSTSKPITTQKIILDPDPPSTTDDPALHISEGSGAFLRTPRDPRTWITPKATGSRAEEFASAAISGEAILKERQRRNWGLEVPWRVTVIKSVGKSTTGSKNGTSAKSSDPITKRKPGKRRRIVLRIRAKKLEEEKERKKKEDEGKEAAEREKKSKKNREKKIKQRLKAKAKAQALKDSGVATTVEAGGVAPGEDEMDTD